MPALTRLPTILAWLELSSWPYLLASLLLVAAIVAIALYRRPHLPAASQALVALALLFLSLAAGGWIIQRPRPLFVTVMVDLSPSTRTAAYRDRAFLEKRIHQLVASAPYRLVYFSDENQTTPPSLTGPLPDVPSDQTVFSPPPAPAILLFSDCQFELPSSGPPTYVAADAMLENPPDASIQRLDVRGQAIAATIANTTQKERSLQLAGHAHTVGQGTSIVSDPLPSQSTITAGLDSPDPWPEDNQLSISAPPPSLSQLWWVGSSAPRGYVAMSPSRLPLSASDYLAPAIVVLNNVPASALSGAQQSLLNQYVRDLGGSLLVLGGDHAFAAGDYPGSALESLSPLASAPPRPTLHWMLLADSSGSMSAAEAGGTRWDLARQSLLSLLPKLPPDDLVSIGSFAEKLTWWSESRPAKETGTGTVSISPNGPTNLENALNQIALTADSSLEKNLLILSDADTTIEHPDELLAALKQKKIHLSLLVIGPGGKALPVLRQLSGATSGQVLVELSPEKWTQSAQKLLSMVAPDHLQRQPMTIDFEGDLSKLPAAQVDLFNRTWLKPSATLLAQGKTTEGVIPLAARWQVGQGQVLCAAFSPTAAQASQMAHLIQHPPRDPRFQVIWDASAQLHVTIDAQSSGKYLNGESFDLLLGTSSHAIPQTGPGRYELILPAPRDPAIAQIHHAGQTLDQFPIPGRYAAEFDSIGNNRAKMERLARQTGGAVIAPTNVRPIDFHWPANPRPLFPWLAALGASFLAAGLALWRRQ